MEKKFIFSQNGLMHFLLMWYMSICNVTCQLCPAEFNGGYMESSCTRVSGSLCIYYCNPGFYKNGSWLSCGENGKWNRDTNSICIKSELCPAEFNGGYMESSCTRVSGSLCIYYCNPGFYKNGSWLSCGENGKWNRDTNSICIKSEKQTSSYGVSRSIGETNVLTIIGITAGSLIGMTIIVFFVIWIAKRSSVRKSKRRVLGHASSRCLGPTEYLEQHITNIRQQPNTNGINRESSFESPSYNASDVHSFVQRIPTISSSCMYPEPPPSYSETQTAPDETPPTYADVVTDPSRFNLYI